MDFVDQISFNASSILDIPLKKYDEDFEFIVNGEKFKTSRIVADLLSSKVIQFHFSDPTLKEYSFHTKENGDFQKILDFIISRKVNIHQEDIPYLLEILEILDNQSIKIYNNDVNTPISLDSAFDQIVLHERYNKYYSSQLAKDIEYISNNFYDIKENHFQILKNLKLETIEMIFNNPNLKIKSEDQVITFINKMYSENNDFSILYEYVNFHNVTKNKMSEFLNIFSIFDITSKIWESFSTIIQQTAIDYIEFMQNNQHNSRYNIDIDIKYEKNHEFEGIIQFLKKKNQNNLNKVLEITSSSIYSNNIALSPQNVIKYDDLKSCFESENENDSWICFDFKDKRIKFTNYTVSTNDWEKGQGHLRSWVVEVSNDENKKDWKIVDKQENCDLLNGKRCVHTFSIQNSEIFRYIRLRQIGPSWSGNSYLNINSIEFYGTLI